MRRLILTTLILSFLLSCKTEYRKTIKKFDNGKVASEFIYPDKADTLNYTIIEYFRSGKISFKGKVENGKFVDLKHSYYENGNLKEVDSIVKPCVLDLCCCDGKVLKYYSNGKLEQSFETKNTATNGLVTVYATDSSGKIWRTMEYKDDKQQGEEKIFYPSGNLYKLETFRSDTLTDHVYYFEKNGDTMKIYYTWNGQEDFPTKKWLKNGQIFFASYLDSTFSKALYRWTDKSGKELKKEIVTTSKKKGWITPN